MGGWIFFRRMGITKTNITFHPPSLLIRVFHRILAVKVELIVNKGHRVLQIFFQILDN